MLNLKYLVDLLNTINLGVILCMWFNLLWKWWFKAIRRQEELDQSLTPIYFFVYHYVSRGYSYYIVDIYSVDSPRHIHCASTHIFRVSFFWVKNSFFFCVRRTAKVSELSSRWNIVESSLSWQLDGATDWRIDERFSTYQIDCHEMFSFKYIIAWE